MIPVTVKSSTRTGSALIFRRTKNPVNASCLSMIVALNSIFYDNSRRKYCSLRTQGFMNYVSNWLGSLSGILVAFIFAGCVSVEYSPLGNPETLADRIDPLFSEFTDTTPGIAVAATRDNEVIFSKGYGSANLESGDLITPNTKFNIGSVSKQFTALSIFLLADEGYLSLEDDIRKYIPELPEFDTAITIQHLCYHTSGTRDLYGLLTLAGWKMDDVITPAQVMNLLSRQENLNFTPGEKFLYSNSGYYLLSEIVSRVSGMSFQDFVQQRIFNPLEMTNSYVQDNYRQVLPGRAYAYSKNADGYQHRGLSNSVTGHSNIYSSVVDLLKWADNFNDPVVGSPELVSRFNQVGSLNSGDNALLPTNGKDKVYVTAGQFKGNFRGTTIFNHSGSEVAYESYLARFPDKNLTIAVTSNLGDFSAFQAGREVATKILGSDITPAVPASNEPTAQYDEPNSPASWPDPALYVGSYYSDELITTYLVSSHDGKLFLDHKRHGKIPLHPVDIDTFNARIVFPVTVKFIRDDQGKVDKFEVSNFGAKDVGFFRN